MPRTRRAVVVAIALLAATGALSPVAHARSAAVQTVRQDFNHGDGRDDIVFGRPRTAYSGDGTPDPSELGERIGVVPGTAQGPKVADPRTIDQDTPGVPGVSESGDLFGTDVAVGDVNGDGYADVVAGSPSESLGGVAAAGQVTVLRGGAAGLTGSGAVSFNQNTANVPGTAEQNDFFGSRAALVDTNRDGRAELQVGAPGENSFDGSVWAFKSTSTGPTATGSVSFGAGTLGTLATDANLGQGFAR